MSDTAATSSVENIEQPAASGVLGETAEPELMDIDPVFLGDGIDLDQLFAARKEIFQHIELCEGLEQIADQLEDQTQEADKPALKRELNTKLGFALWILGRTKDAIECLEVSKNSPVSDFLTGLILLERGEEVSALAALEKAGEKDDGIATTLALIEARTKNGRAAESLKALTKLAKQQSDNPEFHYQHGLALDFEGEYEEALDAYERALEIDSTHSRSAFRLGYMLALRGQEEDALKYYQQCLENGPLHASTLINIGLLYEDARQYEKAVTCYQRVIRVDPTDSLARLYLKDALASLDMYYDEDRQTELERRQDVVGMSINDFELSIRCRTALETIGIQTVGDLVSRTEDELMACENFGETSLREIKIFLNQHSLQLGMSARELVGDTSTVISKPGDQDVLDRLVGELDLSVRSRRCMERLGIVTLRDLTEKTERELLSGKNFGRTSLKEIREKLGTLGVSLADDA